MNENDFAKLDLSEPLQKNLHLLGFASMTEIQAKALPSLLAGKDIIAQAKTGSGKTVCFALGILSRISAEEGPPSAMVICPTRELANQVASEIRKLARLSGNIKILTLCGGTPMGPQSESLKHGANIIVGTPGRLLDHLSRRTLNLSQLRVLVLDEADRMLDMGFSEDISKIIRKAPSSYRQTLLFSATFPEDILSISKEFQKDPVQVTAAASTRNEDIEQHFIRVDKQEKHQVLLALLIQYQPESSIVFCTTKIQCKEVARFLSKSGLSALAIHGDLDQSERDEVMVQFANKSTSILVATDVAARGLDIKDLSAVINFELSKDPEVHVHRIGRTGRAGQKGLALSLVQSNEAFRLEAVEKYMEVKITQEDPPGLIKEKPVMLRPAMRTLKISGGKKNKLRPGDILGALTKQAGIKGDFIGKIIIFDHRSYVAVQTEYAETALEKLSSAKIKNRTFRLKMI